MYVCICKQVTDQQISEAVSEGVTSFSQLQNHLGVATQCGECKKCARQIMREQKRQSHGLQPIPA